MKKSQESLAELFGDRLFSDAVMRVRLPKNTYRLLRQTIDEGVELDPTVAEVVASAMKDWAVERGATHFTHWFQPMAGRTAEKHDSFVMPSGDGGVILEFSGKNLIRGESDASSFPSGGLRAMFEGRGYTVWDCTSPAFIKEDPSGIIALCIPTAFCSYNGEALDKKTPLLRSMEALNKEALRVLRTLGDSETRRVSPTVGIEQEYFLLDRATARKRTDLLYTGRTLVGAPPPKLQESDDAHYCGVIRTRVSSFMAELNEELWRLGVPAKTQHNEASPSQHELATVFSTANIAVDHNEIIMEFMQKVAERHGLTCFLHEKPFMGFSGCGKHNNWSLATSGGENLLDPGKKPHENLRFLLFFMATIASIDRWAPLLLAASSAASNDLRLGEQEAPPRILSVFIGDALEHLVRALIDGAPENGPNSGEMKLGVPSIPLLRLDTTDRNRTSPIAFTGNKFEFRMLGASMHAADLNTAINAMVAEALREAADRLEAAADAKAEAWRVLADWAKKHQRILYSGNNYAAEWQQEAKRRGLPDIRDAVEAIAALAAPDSVAFYDSMGVFTPAELESRATVAYNAYAKTVATQAKTLSSIARTHVWPATMEYAGKLASHNDAMQGANAASRSAAARLTEMRRILDELDAVTTELDYQTAQAGKLGGSAAAQAFRDEVLPLLRRVRAHIDTLELLVDARAWPMPTIGELLYYE